MQVGDIISYPLDKGWQSRSIIERVNALEEVAVLCPSAQIGYEIGVTAQMIQSDPERYEWNNNMAVIVSIGTKFAHGIWYVNGGYYRIRKALG